ncbi:extracellular solute-binding protein [Roseofilum sp. BLCC_M154]|uniref:Extracellular solute-binding protein n=1 Tax=Roseofilum acuticapitatum BLCC-M154 TaxID=3022444 RepID=A0ABT7ARZ0_9CYAN|nr:extracellular solute-binding protein [Roseofilum acuticapitatum]MDJ1169342.1 extracellular solute-binding protein [Roseofilum acuticapitatum BLCC-M154]
MDRRSFLSGSLKTASLALSSLSLSSVLTTGCSPTTRLRIYILKGSIPATLINELKKAVPESAGLEVIPVSQLDRLFASLKQEPKTSGKGGFQGLAFWQTAPPAPDLVTLGDAWLTEAIANQLIQPLDTSLLSWDQLPTNWQSLVMRDRQGNLDPNGEVWGVPYSWGTTAIVYRPDKFKSLGWEPTDWSDLWREELQGHISLLNQPREVIGLTLKSLGYSYNYPDLETIPDLSNTLKKLNQQVKFYSSDQYLQPLIEGDTWLALGWSTDILPVLNRYKLKAIIPQSGTALWANLWVSPNLSPKNSGIQEWINQFLNPDLALKLSQFSDAVSPLLITANQQSLPSSLLKSGIKFPDLTVLSKSEFLLPLSEQTHNSTQNLWQKMRG